MKKIILILLVAFLVASCGESIKETKIEKTEKESSVSEIPPYSNPAIIYGSDFMSFMQSLRKTGNYELMIQFTSSESMSKFGKETIVKFYEEKFTNMSNLELKSITENSDGSKTMNYINLAVATKSATSVVVVIENDSCKLVLPNDLTKKLLN